MDSNPALSAKKRAGKHFIPRFPALFFFLPFLILPQHLQEEEVESVMWMDYEECMARVLDGSLPNCIYPDEFRMVGEYLRGPGGRGDKEQREM